MRIEKIRFGDKDVMPITIPSGIVTTQPSTMKRLAELLPIGIVTGKSVGPEARPGFSPPILHQYMPGGWMNAVGLTNPGAKEYAAELRAVGFPKEKFLLASIFGKDADEFVYVAQTLEDCVDGFEGNFSCPHVQGHGMAIGQDPDLVKRITKAVTEKTRKPFLAKLTPNASNIGAIAAAAVEGGAYGLCAINTVGPGYFEHEGQPILTNKVGGMSGVGILPIGLKAVREIRQACPKSFIIGMGGISTAKDVLAYFNNGANAVGIGSACAGMDDQCLRDYLSGLIDDCNGTHYAEQHLRSVNTDYKRVKVERRIDHQCDFKTLITDSWMENAGPGMFLFAWIPGVGERPFSIVDDHPLTLTVLTRGPFTKALNDLKKGDEFYVRGPYGKPIYMSYNNVALVGGGCGIAGVYDIARHAQRLGRKVRTYLGAKDAKHLPLLEQFGRFGEVFVTTEDGSLGEKGLVTDLLKHHKPRRNTSFFNCGPARMVEAVLPIELRYATPQHIHSSLDYMTRCGIGLCGSCADKKGRRTCVEGPFMPAGEQ